ncbi:hypothetical protein JCM11491_003844 [Sporobolomyces phaffii]
MTEYKNVDHLSRLPPELLEIIFDHVQSSNEPVTAPLSRHLLPFIQEPLFRSLCLISDPYPALDSLCQNVESSRHLTIYVKSLHFHVALDEPKKPPREIHDGHVPSNTLIKALFGRLINLERLVVVGSSRVASIVLEPVVAASSFPKLSSLRLASTFKTVPDPFHSSNFQTLQYYSELSKLSLEVCRPSKTIHSHAKPQIIPLRMKTQIRQVSLKGPLSSSSSTSVTGLLASFGSLSIISLHDTSKESQLCDLVGAIPSPSHVHVLYLNHQESAGLPPKESLDDQLERFTQISCLRFGGTSSSSTPSLYSALARLPHLKHLLFSKDAIVSLAQLAQVIVTGSRIKSKSLKSITFDNVEGKVGTRGEDAGEPWWNEEVDDWDVHPDWIVPNWTDEFSEDGLVEFVKAAEKEGIQVGGSAVDAIGVKDALESEVGWVLGWAEAQSE